MFKFRSIFKNIKILSLFNLMANITIAISTAFIAFATYKGFLIAENHVNKQVKAINKQTEVIDRERKEKNKLLQEIENIDKEMQLIFNEIRDALFYGHPNQTEQLRFLRRKSRKLKIKRKKILEKLEYHK